MNEGEGCSMNKTIPLAKQSKRDRRAYYSEKRNDWNGVIPVTRVIPGKKGYDRKRQRSADRRILGSEG